MREAPTVFKKVGMQALKEKFTLEYIKHPHEVSRNIKRCTRLKAQWQRRALNGPSQRSGSQPAKDVAERKRKRPFGIEWLTNCVRECCLPKQELKE